MKVVVFGVGRFYQERKEELLSYRDIKQVAFIDNNKSLHGTYLNNIPVLPVEQIAALDFDGILLMSAKSDEMKKQLLELKVETEKVWYWEWFKSKQNQGHFHFYCGNPQTCSGRKRVLIITTDLNYNGGTLAAVYAAMVLQKRGYHTILAAPGGNKTFIEEMKNNGLNIAICSALPYLYQEETVFIQYFDLVLVNVFQMILCASEISKTKPVIWWIHEPSDLYAPILNRFQEYATEERLKNAHIYAVSQIPQRNFNRHFPNRITKTLAYGIPDEKPLTFQKNKKDQIIIALIGSVIYRKGQDIFLEAVKKIPVHTKKQALFWIIGKAKQDSYGDEVRRLSAERGVSMLGEMTREEIRKAYEDIDILVCPSREDPLPIVVTEAMMFEKACIVSDSIGMADYILEGENGLICKTGDANDLAKKMSWMIDNRDKLEQIGYHARKTYEENFTMERFGTRLEKICNEYI